MEIKNIPNITINIPNPDKSDKPDKPDIIIMSTWDINGTYNNKVCGHIYEVVEYFWVISKFFDKYHLNTKFIFPNDYNIEAILSKYTFNDSEKEYIRNGILPQPKNGIINTKDGNGIVLIVDGNLGNFKGIIRGTPVQFSCGLNGLYPNANPNNATQYIKDWYLIHDNRLKPYYYDISLENKMQPKEIFDYNKKILFSKLKAYATSAEILSRNGSNYMDNISMLYLTKNCKYLSNEKINKLIEKYNISSKKLLIFTDYEINPDEINIPNDLIQIVDISSNPVDIFSYDWTTYFYTEIERKWDCSNRLLPECMIQNRWFVIDVENPSDDLHFALKARYVDIENDFKIYKEWGFPQNRTFDYNPNIRLNLADNPCPDNIIYILRTIIDDVRGA